MSVSLLIPQLLVYRVKNFFNENFQLTKCDPDFIIPNGFDENDKKTRDKCLYLKQLLADKNIISRMPGTFLHMERLLDDGKSHEIHSYIFFSLDRNDYIFHLKWTFFLGIHFYKLLGKNVFSGYSW